MPLQTTGPISLSQVNAELGNASTTQISLGQSSVRTLAGVASGQISLSNLYGKGGVQFVGYNGNGDNMGANYQVPVSNYFNGNGGRTPQVGDFVVAFHALANTSGGDRTMTVLTSGFTKVADLFQSNIYASNLGVSYWFISGSVPEYIDVAGSGLAYMPQVTTIFLFRGVNTSQPFSVSLTSASGTGINVNPPPITPTHAGSVILAGGCFSYQDPSVFPGYNPPAGQDHPTYYGTFIQTPYPYGAVVSTQSTWTSGTVDPPQWTFNPTSVPASSWIGVSLAIRPA